MAIGNKIGSYLQLNLLVLGSSLIPIIVIFITLPPLEIVFYRTLAATSILGIILYAKGFRKVLPHKEVINILLTGVLTAFYWLFIVISAKISNASVCLVGISSASIWTSFILHFTNREPIKEIQIISGILVIVGILVITSFDFQHPIGLAVAISAGFMGALVTVINGKLSREYNHHQITFYQMAGACLGTIIFAPVDFFFFRGGWQPILEGSIIDYALILFLAVTFSIVVYAKFIKLMRTLTPFTVTLTSNLSTIYGIVAAIIFLGDSEKMGLHFYIGSSIIVASILLHQLGKEYIR